MNRNTPKIVLKTVGFVNLISRRKGATSENTNGKKTVKVFKTKAALTIFRIGQELKAKAKKAKEFAAAFLKSSRLESHIMTAKKAIETAKKSLLSTAERFKLWVNLLHAYNDLKTFKFSLPKNLRINLF